MTTALGNLNIPGRDVLIFDINANDPAKAVVHLEHERELSLLKVKIQNVEIGATNLSVESKSLILSYFDLDSRYAGIQDALIESAFLVSDKLGLKGRVRAIALENTLEAFSRHFFVPVNPVYKYGTTIETITKSFQTFHPIPETQRKTILIQAKRILSEELNTPVEEMTTGFVSKNWYWDLSTQPVIPPEILMSRFEHPFSVHLPKTASHKIQKVIDEKARYVSIFDLPFFRTDEE